MCQEKRSFIQLFPECAFVKVNSNVPMIFALQSVQDNASNEETTCLEFLKSSTYAQLLVLCNYV
jgi:hypothetical protein